MSGSHVISTMAFMRPAPWQTGHVTLTPSQSLPRPQSQPLPWQYGHSWSSLTISSCARPLSVGGNSDIVLCSLLIVRHLLPITHVFSLQGIVCHVFKSACQFPVQLFLVHIGEVYRLTLDYLKQVLYHAFHILCFTSMFFVLMVFYYQSSQSIQSVRSVKSALSIQSIMSIIFTLHSSLLTLHSSLFTLHSSLFILPSLFHLPSSLIVACLYYSILPYGESLTCLTNGTTLAICFISLHSHLHTCHVLQSGCWFAKRLPLVFLADEYEALSRELFNECLSSLILLFTFSPFCILEAVNDDKLGTLAFFKPCPQIVKGVVCCHTKLALHLIHLVAVDAVLKALAHAFLITQVKNATIRAKFFGKLHHKAALSACARSRHKPCLCYAWIAKHLAPFLTPGNGDVCLCCNIPGAVCSLCHRYASFSFSISVYTRRKPPFVFLTMVAMSAPSGAFTFATTSA
nr:MAG TPA: hypothetical protein [Caudoviricetes sp.]